MFIKKNMSNYKNEYIPKTAYKCPNCMLVPEIININYSENKIYYYCPFHKNNEKQINDYLNSMLYITCNNCKTKILSDKKSNYCYNCKKILCSKCVNICQSDHFLINFNEYNILCQIHKGNKYLFYCYNCSSNLCESCFDNHDNNHNIQPLSNIFISKEDIDFIINKNKEYEKIIQIYKNYISLNNLILDAFNYFKNNFYYIKNIKNVIRYIKNSDLNVNNFTRYQKNMQEQSSILEKFNSEFDTELDLDSDVIYLNWKNIYKESLESLTKIEFNKIKEFQSVGTYIEDLTFLKNAKFPILQELYLTDNNIYDISILEKVEFPLMKIIYLNKNKIEDISVFNRVNFPELNKLFLDGNYISDISVIEKIPSEGLENLNLSRNKISDISCLKKIKLKFLRLLNIKKNKIDYSINDNLDIINELRDKSIRIVY